MGNPTLHPTTPKHLLQEDKTRTDNLWRDHLCHFNNELTLDATLNDNLDDYPYKNLPAPSLWRLVLSAWNRGEYGDDHDPTILKPKVNETVKDALDSNAKTREKMVGRLSKGNNVYYGAKQLYLVEYEKLYIKLWLSKHQEMVNESLKAWIEEREKRVLKMLRAASQGDPEPPWLDPLSSEEESEYADDGND